MMEILKVCVRVPANKKEELLMIAKNWRAELRGPGWDAKIIHEIAREKFGGLKQMFQHHGWSERGSDMMRHVQRRVKETYGSIENFADRHRD
ncbi:hypothetical protein [Roseivivax sp. THAF40]|uniref:hypothetical protein n=1 Tax=Roseivivax sp. THAF40 TaxID=2587858 RepID=UPI001561CD14|nr:hypothetical protein [Roseivivax sp. THAF40]